jgi:hypothetical protein
MEHIRRIASTLVCVLMFAFVVSSVVGSAHAAAAQEETIVGTVVKTDKGYIIEAEDGDYLVKGQDVSKMAGKMIEATGIIIESDKGDVIEVKSFEEIQE